MNIEINTVPARTHLHIFKQFVCFVELSSAGDFAMGISLRQRSLMVRAERFTPKLLTYWFLSHWNETVVLWRMDSSC